MLRFWLLLAVFLVSGAVFGKSLGRLEMEFALSPAGTFMAKSEDVEGKIEVVGEAYSAEKISIPVASLKTGISLRDEHLRKRLTGDKGQFTHIIGTDVKGKDGKGTFKLMANGVTKELPFTFEKLGANHGKGTFTLSLKDFSIKDVSYLGVGVEDETTVTVYLNW